MDEQIELFSDYEYKPKDRIIILYENDDPWYEEEDDDIELTEEEIREIIHDEEVYADFEAGRYTVTPGKVEAAVIESRFGVQNWERWDI